MKKMIVWYKPKTKSYYYKIVHTFYKNYEIGYKNSYDHEVVLIIDDIFYHHSRIRAIIRRLLTSTISFLENTLKKI